MRRGGKWTTEIIKIGKRSKRHKPSAQNINEDQTVVSIRVLG